jgi:hypothetical protein
MYVSINVPEIKEYSEGFPQYWLKTLFIQPVSSSFQVNALASTYVRLVEAALVEYQLSKTKGSGVFSCNCARKEFNQTLWFS